MVATSGFGLAVTLTTNGFCKENDLNLLTLLKPKGETEAGADRVYLRR